MGNCHKKADTPSKPVVPKESKDILRYGDIDIHGIEITVRPFVISNDGYRRVMDLMLDNMFLGLGKKTQETAKMKMWPSYVRHLPDGTETGEYLALDIGGTNFRVLLVRFMGAERAESESKMFPIPQKIMLGTGTALFDHIVDCISQFTKEFNLEDTHLPLGFTWSFPCKQIGLNKAILTVWTKGFKCAGVVGNDAVQMLNEALQRRSDVKVECLAVLNDTVGALMSCAHEEPDCAIGVIVDSGTNAAYIERLDAVENWDEDFDEPKQVIINTEWGAFGDDGCLDQFRTDYDRDVDKHSLHQGKQLYEKMLAGIYIGEIVRLIMEKLWNAKLVMQGKDPHDLILRGRFYTKFVCEIMGDGENTFTHTEQVFEKLGIDDYTNEDLRIAQYVCSVVSRRAAYLCAAGIATILNHMNRPNVTIAMDGSLYRFHPTFHDLMEQKISELVNPGIKFQMVLAQDGTGRGAAVVAAVYSKQTKQAK